MQGLKSTISTKKSWFMEMCCGRTAALTLCHRIVIVAAIFCTISTKKKLRVIKTNSNDPHLLENLPALKQKIDVWPDCLMWKPE